MSEIEVRQTGIQLVLDLERAGALTATDLTLPPDLDLERWASVGYFFGAIKKSSSWWLASWLIFGEAAFSEKMSQAVEVTGLAPETLSHYVRVYERVAPSRRRESLSFGCHAAVADLPPAGQKRWLSLAEKEGWGTLELRKAIQEADREKNGSQTQIEGTDTPAYRVDSKLVVEVAFAILRDARETDDGYALVPVETLTRLRAALGKED